jgi:hypothetical protein
MGKGSLAPINRLLGNVSVVAAVGKRTCLVSVASHVAEGNEASTQQSRARAHMADMNSGWGHSPNTMHAWSHRGMSTEVESEVGAEGREGVPLPITYATHWAMRDRADASSSI